MVSELKRLIDLSKLYLKPNGAFNPALRSGRFLTSQISKTFMIDCQSDKQGRKY
jgi:hypothetical protein